MLTNEEAAYLSEWLTSIMLSVQKLIDTPDLDNTDCQKEATRTLAHLQRAEADLALIREGEDL